MDVKMTVLDVIMTAIIFFGCVNKVLLFLPKVKKQKMNLKKKE